jgi:4-amino-4-deoxy-L-arabinose transferase-like glycosyltransferase
LQQAPLYYWIVSVPLRYAETWPIARRVLLIRLLSCAIASFVIPATWFAARRLLSSGEALVASAILASAPGFAIDSARVANDCLAIALVAVLTGLLVRPERRWAPIGLTLGAAFLTKAYLLALLPGVAISWPRRQWNRLAAALLLAAVLAAWWYIANPLAGRTVSGWEGSPSLSQLAAGVFRINWFSAAQVWTKSFLWTGGWSFLGVKSWIYLVIEILGAIALAGLLGSPRELARLRVPLALTGCFLAAMIYATLGNFATNNVPTAPGWYWWAVACPLAMLFTAGMRKWSAVLIAVFMLLDLYGANAVMMPYYAGFVARNRASLGYVTESLTRLDVPVGLWLAYVAATLAIPALGIYFGAGAAAAVNSRRTASSTPFTK